MLEGRRVTCYAVEAGGAPAKWIEATVATSNQSTALCFVGDRPGTVSWRLALASAAQLAVATGARVLVVGTLHAPVQRLECLQDGLAAYRWLLGEGVDLTTTAFADGAPGCRLAEAIFAMARRLGLPLPAGGAGRECGKPSYEGPRTAAHCV